MRNGILHQCSDWAVYYWVVLVVSKRKDIWRHHFPGNNSKVSLTPKLTSERKKRKKKEDQKERRWRKKEVRRRKSQMKDADMNFSAWAFIKSKWTNFVLFLKTPLQLYFCCIGFYNHKLLFDLRVPLYSQHSMFQWHPEYMVGQNGSHRVQKVACSFLCVVHVLWVEKEPSRSKPCLFCFTWV